MDGVIKTDDFLLILVTTMTLSVMLMVMLFFLRDRSVSRYDLSKNRAILSDMRESYEFQIAKLNDRLMSTEKRWEDINHLLI